MLGETNIDPDPTYYSEKHKTTINVRNLISFPAGGKKREEYHESTWFLQHKTTIGEISEGKSLWNDENGEIRVNTIIFQDYIRKHWIIVPLNTQLFARWVKYANE